MRAGGGVMFERRILRGLRLLMTRDDFADRGVSRAVTSLRSVTTSPSASLKSTMSGCAESGAVNVERCVSLSRVKFATSIIMPLWLPQNGSPALRPSVAIDQRDARGLLRIGQESPVE